MYCQRHFKNALPFSFPLCLIVDTENVLDQKIEHCWEVEGVPSSPVLRKLTNCIYSRSVREPNSGEKKLLSQTQAAPGQSSICWVSVIVLKPVHISSGFTVLPQLLGPSAASQTGLPRCLRPGHAHLPIILSDH